MRRLFHLNYDQFIILKILIEITTHRIEMLHISEPFHFKPHLNAFIGFCFYLILSEKDNHLYLLMYFTKMNLETKKL